MTCHICKETATDCCESCNKDMCDDCKTLCYDQMPAETSVPENYAIGYFCHKCTEH